MEANAHLPYNQLRSERFLRAAPSVKGQPSRPCTDWFFFSFRNFSQNETWKTRCSRRTRLIQKWGKKKKNQSEFKFKLVQMSLKQQPGEWRHFVSQCFFFFFLCSLKFYKVSWCVLGGFGHPLCLSGQGCINDLAFGFCLNNAKANPA